MVECEIAGKKVIGTLESVEKRKRVWVASTEEAATLMRVAQEIENLGVVYGIDSVRVMSWVGKVEEGAQVVERDALQAQALAREIMELSDERGPNTNKYKSELGKEYDLLQEGMDRTKEQAAALLVAVRLLGEARLRLGKSQMVPTLPTAYVAALAIADDVREAHSIREAYETLEQQEKG